MFVPGRSRRERPIGGLGSGVRAFVRSVLRLKVWDSEIPRVFAELASVTVPNLVRASATSGGCFKNSWESLTLPVRRHNAQAILAAPRSESSTAAAPPQSGAHALPSATPAPRTRSSHPPPRSPPHANPLLALLVSLVGASLRVALGEGDEGKA